MNGQTTKTNLVAKTGLSTDAGKKRIALVTGGLGGIGNAICRALARDGHRVVSTFSRPGREVQWLKTQQAEGYEMAAYACDVSDFAACQQLAQRILQELGPVDVLVNNAGITRDKAFRKMEQTDWDAVLRTNLDSVFNVTRPLVDGMMERGFGRIINIASINGQKGQFGQTNYSAAKAGMHGFTMALAQEVAKKGVTVNTISPGYIATEMVLAVKEDVRQKIIDTIPVGRLGKPEEIADLVAYLASPRAAFVTGANIAINGGQFIH